MPDGTSEAAIASLVPLAVDEGVRRRRADLDLPRKDHRTPSARRRSLRRRRASSRHQATSPSLRPLRRTTRGGWRRQRRTPRRPRGEAPEPTQRRRPPSPPSPPKTPAPNPSRASTGRVAETRPSPPGADAPASAESVSSGLPEVTYAVPDRHLRTAAGQREPSRTLASAVLWQCCPSRCRTGSRRPRLNSVAVVRYLFLLHQFSIPLSRRRQRACAEVRRRWMTPQAAAASFGRIASK